MSIPRQPLPAKLVVGFFLAEKSLGPAAVSALCERFGPVDLVSAWLPFDYTDYYRAEMGGNLLRRLVSFTRLVDPGQLATIKAMTNVVEQQMAVNGKRLINFDPGTLTAAQFVLATGKNYSHRIYLGQGIFADLTLVFSRGAFRPLAWTYPDYRDDALLSFLGRARRKYLVDVKPAVAHPCR